MHLDEIRKKLSDRNLKAVAEKIGVHPNAIYRLMNGKTNPSYETVSKIIAYLDANA